MFDRYTTQIAIEVLNEQELAKLQALLLQLDQAQRQFAQGAGQVNKGATSFKTSATMMTQSGSQVTGTLTEGADGVKRFGVSVKQTADDVANGSKKMTVSWQAVRRVITGVIIARALGKVSQAFSRSAADAFKFRMAIEEIRTLQGNYIKSASAWADALHAVSDASAIDVLSVAEGAYQGLSNQVINAADAHLFLADSSRLANVAATDMETSVSALSSILNSYNYNISKGEEVSAALFATVVQGRLRLDDIANSIGNVTIVASKLGITYQEVLAAVAHLTRQGTSAANAQTYMRNAMLALLKPSKSMRAALAEIGYASAEVALQQESLLTLLGKLYAHADLAGSELEELAKLFPRIRGLIGAAGLSGDLEQANDILGKVTNSMGDFHEKLTQYESSTTFSLKKELNEIRNDWLKFGEALQEVAGHIPFLSEAMKVLSIAIGVTLVAAIIKFTVAAVKWTGVWKAIVWLVGAAGAALGKFAAVVGTTTAGLIALGAAAGYAGYWIGDKLYNYFFRTKRALQIGWDDIAEDAQRMADKQYRAWSDAMKDSVEATDKMSKEIESIFDAAAAEIARITEAAIKGLDKIKDARDDYLDTLDTDAQKASVLKQYMADAYRAMLAAERAGQTDIVKEMMERVKDYIEQYKDLEKFWTTSRPNPNAQGQQRLYPELVDPAADKSVNRMLSEVEKRYELFAANIGSYMDQVRKVTTADAMKATMDAAHVDVNDWIARQKAMQKQLDDTTKAMTAAYGEMSAASKKTTDFIKEDVGDWVAATDRASNIFEGTYEQIKAAFTDETWAEILAKHRDLAAAQENVERSTRDLASALEAQANSDKPITPEDAEYAAQLALNLRANIEALREAGVEIPTSVEAQLSVLIYQARRVEEAASAIKRVNTALEETTKEIQKKSGPIAQMVNDLQHGANLSSTFSANWSSAMAGVRTEVQQLSNAIANMARVVGNIKADIEQASQAARNLRENSGGLIHFASGGTVMRRFASGGSAWGVGRDRLLAALQPGEFVMNQQDTARFFPQLVAMNSGGSSPLAAGENITVGDINITVAGGDTSEQSVREIAQELDRAIRRRVVRFR